MLKKALNSKTETHPRLLPTIACLTKLELWSQTPVLSLSCYFVQYLDVNVSASAHALLVILEKLPEFQVKRCLICCSDSG